MEFAQASQSFAIKSKAIDIPPEAEPVTPAKIFTVTASDN
jgi:hypothetical protein